MFSSHSSHGAHIELSGYSTVVFHMPPNNNLSRLSPGRLSHQMFSSLSLHVAHKDRPFKSTTYPTCLQITNLPRLLPGRLSHQMFSSCSTHGARKNDRPTSQFARLNQVTVQGILLLKSSLSQSASRRLASEQYSRISSVQSSHSSHSRHKLCRTMKST